MIVVMKGRGENLEIVQEYQEGVWVHVVDPSIGEMEGIGSSLDIPLDFLRSPLDADELPRTEIENGTTLIIIRIPYFDEHSDVHVKTIPLGVILKKGILISICKNENEMVQDMVKGKFKGFSTRKRNRMILQIFYMTAASYLEYLKEINKRSSEFETQLHKAMRNEQLIELLNLEKSLVYITTSLRANEIVLEKLQRYNVLKMYEEDKDLLEDVIIENKQALEMATIYTNILSGTMDAFASVISNNLGVVVKFLTAVTIILMIPTMVASYYGMNVDLPFQKSSHAFLYTIIISVAISAGGVYLFWKKKLF